MLKLTNRTAELLRYKIEYKVDDGRKIIPVTEHVASDRQRDALLRRWPDAVVTPIEQSGNEWIEGMTFDSLAEARTALEQGVSYLQSVKLAEIGTACTATIFAGVELDDKRFSLTDHDQTELMAQLSAVKEGAAAVPYHADGEVCRMYPAAEFNAVAATAMAHILYHRTYCNHLNVWIRRTDDADVLKGITYGSELPDDLLQNMVDVLEAAQNEASA